MTIRGLTEVSLFSPAFFSLVYRIWNKHIGRCSHSPMHFLINTSEASPSAIKYWSGIPCDSLVTEIVLANETVKTTFQIKVKKKKKRRQTIVMSSY